MSYGATDRGSWRRVEWEYDSWGRRVRQTSYVLTNGVWQVVEDLKLVSDPELFGRHIAELNATNNAPVRAYTWGLDLSETLDAAGGVGGLLWVRAATGPAAGTHFVTHDGNGNVWNLVSASTGTETARYEYGPFGEPLRLSGPAARSNPFQMSTKRTEDFRGLVLYEYRAYSPTSGRWLSRDPIGERGGASLLAFLGNEPVNGIDAHGLLWPGYPDMPGTPKPPPTPRPPEPQYPEGFAICTRPVAVDGVNDIVGKVANCCGGEHTFIQYVRYPTPPAEGPPFVWGWGFSGGIEATEERHFGATHCVTCQKADRPLKHGPAAGHGKTGKSATDTEIRECIMARIPDRRYSYPWYVCTDWAYQAAEDCGLKCR
ncbi:RHS repeat-associated core domain-containing protein [Limisphaera sp. 4302-co]|uniref:RHS repeat-associated core domain-containing protein n=1 Tax=Limisphaera sp. 4302-co TaxID=3400417 RepID=UPI003C13779E